MTIRVYPVKIEATDENDDLAFTLESFDEHTAQAEVKMLLNNNNIKEFTEALRKGIALLELEEQTHEL